MSRYAQKITDTKTAVYGFDHMLPLPQGGYFFEIWDNSYPENTWDDGAGKMILCEGLVGGISKEKMLELVTEYNVINPEHIKSITAGLPI